MATGGKDRGSREARERARLYQARQELHTAQGRRRRRDDVLAGIVGGIVILAAIGSQVAYFTAGPGAPEPAPSPSITEPATDAPSPSPEPTAPSDPSPGATG